MNKNNNMNLYPEDDVRNAISVALSAKLYDQFGLQKEHDSFNATVEWGIMGNYSTIEIDNENFIDIGSQDLDAFVEEAIDFDIKDNSMFDAAVTQKYNVSKELYCDHELLAGRVACFLISVKNKTAERIMLNYNDPHYMFFLTIGKDIAMISSNNNDFKIYLSSAKEGYISALSERISKIDLLRIAKKLQNIAALDLAIVTVKENQKMEAFSC
jgi:hypothetical protein